MGLGSTAKKIQTVADIAEKLYTKVNEIRDRVVSMQQSVESTDERVGNLERDLAEQRAVVEALAESQGVDVEAAVANADLPETGEEVTSTAEGGDADLVGDEPAEGTDPTADDGGGS